MKEQVERALQALIGLPLWAVGHAADVWWLQFGERRTVAARHGSTKEVGAYALHLQCAWRLVGPSAILVGSRDRFYRQAQHLPQDHVFIVESARADPVGGFRLALNDGYVLEVFPDGRMPGEHWRLFQPSTEEEHFVVTPQGIER